MRRPFRCLITGLTLSAAVGLAACDDGNGDTIEVRDAWARATPAGATTGAVYMTVRSADDDALVGASVDPSVAATATAHETVSDEGRMTMTQTHGVALPAGDDVSFEPGGQHLMLEDLAAPLDAGESFELTLDFAAAPDLTISVDVREDQP